MGKKHRQPQPIDILNVPSPATLLGAGGYVAEKAGTGSASSPVSGDRAFPGSPVTEDIEDYGDRGASSRSSSLLGAENFSSQSDDGNDGSSHDDGAETPDSSDDESVTASGETSGDETNIRVDFEVNEMASDDIDAVMHLMDQLVPDHLNEVDRDNLGLQFLNSPYTSLVQVGSGSSARTEEADEGATAEVYGMVSILDIATSSATSLVSLVSLLRTSVWTVAAPGISVADLLQSRAPNGRAKAVLLVSEHIRNVPLEIVSRTLTFAVDQFEADARRDSHLPFVPHLGKGGVFAVFPCSFVILAKIQRTKDTTERHDSATAPAKKKSRTESVTAGKLPPFKMEDYTFWREEDETLFQLRDTRVAVHVYRCRPQYDTQPDVERPLTISFALSTEGMRRGLEQIRRKEELQPVE